jgi:hypothetical protein
VPPVELRNTANKKTDWLMEKKLMKFFLTTFSVAPKIPAHLFCLFVREKKQSKRAPILFLGDNGEKNFLNLTGNKERELDPLLSINKKLFSRRKNKRSANVLSLSTDHFSFIFKLSN